MTPEIEMFLQLNNPDYQRGYEDGFNDYRRVVIDELKDLIRRMEKSKVFTTETSTVSN